MHIITAKAIALGEAMKPEFKTYQEQILKNAKVLAQSLMDSGFDLVSGGTDNHLMLIDLRTKFPDVTGRMAEKELEKAEITLNKNMVPFDTRSPFKTSGVRVGTPAITSRGFVEKDMVDIVELIDTVLTAVAKYADVVNGVTTEGAEEYAKVLETVKHKVHNMTAGRPLNRY